MACKCPLRAPAYSASVTTKLSPSILFTFHLSPSKRHRLTTCSLHNSNFLSSPISSRRRPISGVKIQKSKNAIVCSASNQKKRQSLNFKTLFGKKYLWRRILFASRKVRSIILLNVITVVYASNIPVVKEIEAVMDPATFTVVRFVVAAIPFLPFALQSWDDARIRNAGIELGFWVSLGYLTQALGLLTSDAGRASFISMFTVIVVPLLDGMLGAIVPAQTWFGALMSIVGVAMLESSGSPPSIGDLLNFLSAVFFGVHMLRTEHISRSTDKKNFLPLLGFEMAAMRDVSATETAIIYGLEPVWGAGFAWFLLGERWGATGWIGAAFVLGGSLMVQICGSSSSCVSGKDELRSEKVDHLLVSDKQNDFSTSPVRVISKKDVPKILKK
ncbi:PREDICTED: uncharacterized protein LOC105135456 isoform X2 [Populus euphratica]|uniref:Uncharacterized protein LOC105135456 isoform X2 n=1 Tax=Populus euphratica TaxID=75702 RepID=A0AAJ6V126_POPEU|nr:PREDICTED: uncharacterized protein LOC105135456 isoform X2 [Populus euphratica]